MSKAVSKGAHWMSRTSQFSTHGSRTGRVDVLPPNAKMPLYTELRERYERQKKLVIETRDAYLKHRQWVKTAPEFHGYRHLIYEHKRRTDDAVMPSALAKALDRLDELRAELTASDARLQDYKDAFFSETTARYESTWVKTAKLVLPHDVVSQIEEMVSLARARNFEQQHGNGGDGR